MASPPWPAPDTPSSQRGLHAQGNLSVLQGGIQASHDTRGCGRLRGTGPRARASAGGDRSPPSRAPGCRTNALSAGRGTASQGDTRAATRRVATVPSPLLGEEDMNHAPKREIARPVHLGRTRFIPYLSEIPQRKPKARASQEKATAKIPEHVALGLLALDPPPIPLMDARGPVLLACSWGIPRYSTPRGRRRPSFGGCPTRYGTPVAPQATAWIGRALRGR